MERLRLWLILVVFATIVGAKKDKRAPPVAVEAQFKDRIATKLRAAQLGATNHLARSLGVIDGEAAGSALEKFGHYELEMEGKGKWRDSCEEDIDPTKDSIVLCVMHKLQALTALCEVDGAAEQHRTGVLKLLNELVGKRDKVIRGLGVKRSLLPVTNKMESWFHETSPNSGEYDVSVALHAAAMLTMVQCGSALGKKELFSDVQSWFVAVDTVYPRPTWGNQSFHANSILWESFTILSETIRRDSSFAEDIKDFVNDFESYLSAVFAENERFWSFSGAHAAVISWATEKKAARKKRLGKAVDEYITRWKAIAPGLNTSASYTCGPLQGVAPLLLKRGTDAAELVSSVLRMMEKDVDLFQISVIGEQMSPAAARVGKDLMEARGAELEGAFVRDPGQLKAEKRLSIRIDDTAQCVIALTRTLQLLDDLVGVEVSAPEAGGGADPGEAEEEL